MSRENIELAQALYAAFNQRDRAGVTRLLCQDFVADMSQSIGPEKGVYRGVEAFGELLDGYWDAMETYEIVPAEVVDVEGRDVVGTQGTAVGRASGAEVNATGGHLLSFRDGGGSLVGPSFSRSRKPSKPPELSE